MEVVSKQDIAGMLLSIGAVSINVKQPFVYSSGLHSPIYCDNRLLISYPKRRRIVRDAFVSAIIDINNVDCVAGTATAGIPHAAWVADVLQKPMIYVRSKAKGHGRGNQIEGFLEPGQKVLLLEDLISTGGSLFNAAQSIADADGEVVQAISIFTYQFAVAEKAISESAYPITALCDLETLLEVALQQHMIEAGDIDLLRDWQHNPEEWSNKVEG